MTAVERLDAAQARELTDRAKERLSFASEVALAAVEDITAVVDGGGWSALGYATPAAYLLAEFDVSSHRLDPAGRRELALTLVGNGVSRRAAAKALGVSEGTVRNDLSGAQNYAPERVLGTDGKTYPALPAPPTEYERQRVRALDIIARFGLPTDDDLVRELTEVWLIREAARGLLRYDIQDLPPPEWKPVTPRSSAVPSRQATHRLIDERNRLAEWELRVMREAGDFLNWCDKAGIEVGRRGVRFAERLTYPVDDPAVLPDDWTADDSHQAARGHFYAWYCTHDELRSLGELHPAAGGAS